MMEFINSKMKNKRILVPLMNGFEETEYIAVRDVLIRENVDVDSISLTGDKTILANHNTRIGADMVYGVQNFNVDDYDGIFIPGGLIGVNNLDSSLEFDNIINAFHGSNKVVAAICAAPTLLAKRGMLKDKEATCFPGKDFINALTNNGAIYKDDEVFVVSDRIITGKDYISSIRFGFELANLINEWK